MSGKSGKRGKTGKIDVYLEEGKQKTFACAVEWPGWTRSGKDEAGALQALQAAAARYAAVIKDAHLNFQPPDDSSAFAVIERLPGDATTDFGAPGAIPAIDAREVEAADTRRFLALLDAYWGALEAAARAARGKDLRKGPRGGGRELEEIVQHVLNAERSYVRRLGWQPEQAEPESLAGRIEQARRSFAEALPVAARGDLPAQGPRGGARWPLRYYVRRSGWHILDHVWEIEDRII